MMRKHKQIREQIWRILGIRLESILDPEEDLRNGRLGIAEGTWNPIAKVLAHQFENKLKKSILHG